MAVYTKNLLNNHDCTSWRAGWTRAICTKFMAIICGKGYAGHLAKFPFLGIGSLYFSFLKSTA
jgi:hypothetical protein